MYFALCDGTAHSIYAFAETEEKSKELLWGSVHDYLKKADAPITSNYNAEELEGYFGCTVLKVENNKTGFLNG